MVALHLRFVQGLRSISTQAYCQHLIQYDDAVKIMGKPANAFGLKLMLNTMAFNLVWL